MLKSPLTAQDIEHLTEVATAATPGSWSWWSSNSHYRLSSDDTGKDGDVISAVKAADGMAVINCNARNREFIETFDPACVMQLLKLARERFEVRSLPDLSLITLPGEM